MARIVSTEKLLSSAPQVTPALRSAAAVVAATALIAVCAHISFPLFFTPVPLTLQPFAVLLVGLLLAPEVAFSAMVLYLLEGAAGLPVFTPHGPGGVMQILGPTGGYLLSYLVAAPLVSWLRRGGELAFMRAVWSAAVGNVVILTLGAAWLWVLVHPAMRTLLMQAVLPFVPGDALKVVAAAAVATGLQTLRIRKDSTAAS